GNACEILSSSGFRLLDVRSERVGTRYHCWSGGGSAVNSRHADASRFRRHLVRLDRGQIRQSDDHSPFHSSPDRWVSVRMSHIATESEEEMQHCAFLCLDACSRYRRPLYRL